MTKKFIILCLFCVVGCTKTEYVYVDGSNKEMFGVIEAAHQFIRDHNIEDKIILVPDEHIRKIDANEYIVVGSYIDCHGSNHDTMKYRLVIKNNEVGCDWEMWNPDFINK